MATRSEAPLIVFAPGAGAGSSSPWMQRWRDRLATFAPVATLDYPYRLAGRKAPDKLPVLIAAHRAAIGAARAQHPDATRVVLAGKSMGGRVGCHVAVEDGAAGGIAGVVCFGYPLRGAGGGLRDEVLLALRVPVLFIQGTRDPLCPLDLLADARARMTAPNQLLIVDGGNHSLEVPRRPAHRAAQPPVPAATTAPAPQDAADDRILQAVAAFVAGLPISAK